MLVYLYNHNVNEIKEDARYLDTEIANCSAHKKNITMIRYCKHCNSTLVGYWEYVNFFWTAHLWDSEARAEYENKTLDMVLEFDLSRESESRKIYFCKNSLYFKNKRQENVDSFCYYLPPLKEGERIRFEFDEQKKKDLKPLVEVSPKIIKYRKEIEKFFSMEICPICKSKLEKQANRHIFFSFLSSDVYKNLCSEFPNHIFENHKSTERLEKSKAPEYILGLSENEPFEYNGRLANKIYPRKDKYYQIDYFSESSLESMLTYFNHFLAGEADEAAKLKIKETTEEFNVKSADKVFNKGTFDTDTLRNYLNHICQLENNIFSITERLKELYTLHFVSEKDAMVSQLIDIIDLNKELEKKKEIYSMIEKTTPENDISIENFAFDYPEKPLPPTPPKQPKLKSAGLFNKKKTATENNLLTLEYQAKLTAYNVEMELYAEKLRRYDYIIEESKRRQKELYSVKIEEACKSKQEKLNKLAQEIKELESEIAEIENTNSDIATPEKIKNKLIESEIREAEKLLCETYKALNELYGYGVIYSKYRNFVAVSTFYEYLLSGRCTVLEGVDGAYNMYESEIRANQIISQLSQVVTSLDKIKQNQYAIYSAIQESNKQLAQLNRSMTSAVSVLDSIDVTTKNMSDTMEKISENTAISAYNSSVTAYYSKKNAELTKALGYMIALS